jgi:hypothetical protein
MASREHWENVYREKQSTEVSWYQPHASLSLALIRDNSTPSTQIIDVGGQSVRPGGLVLVATFADDGPTRCSGLPVERYSAEQLHHAFGDDFQLLDSRREHHTTPSGNERRFVYCLCRYQPRAGSRAAA